MEAPIKFDVWAKVTPGSENEIINLVREKSTYKSELEIKKVVNLSKISNEVLLIARSQSYNEAMKLLENLRKILKDSMLCQEGWTPADSPNYCKKHELHYGGVLGCHICEGFYVK